MTRAVSRRQVGQLSGSLTESSGWGSRMISPLSVFLTVGSAARDVERRRGEVARLVYPVAREECEVLAGAWCRPRGSLRLLASRRTDPGSECQQARSEGVEVLLYWDSPGTSIVSLSFRTPMLHLGVPSSLPSRLFFGCLVACLRKKSILAGLLVRF